MRKRMGASITVSTILAASWSRFIEISFMGRGTSCRLGRKQSNLLPRLSCRWLWPSAL
jgi:hypothetical protein